MNESTTLEPHQRARQPKQKEQRRDAILNAAFQMFIANQHKLPTVAQIASECGLAKGTAYLYFETKEAIFLALYEQQQAAWLQSIEKRLRYPEEDKLQQWQEAFLSFREQQPHLWALAALSYSALEPALKQNELLAYRARTANRLQHCCREIERLLERSDERVYPTLLSSMVFAIGQWQQSFPLNSVRSVNQNSAVKQLQPDFYQAMAAVMPVLWRPLFAQQEQKEPENKGLSRWFGR